MSIKDNSAKYSEIFNQRVQIIKNDIDKLNEVFDAMINYLILTNNYYNEINIKIK